MKLVWQCSLDISKASHLIKEEEEEEEEEEDKWNTRAP